MSAKDLSPKAEPVAWSVIVAAIIAALASYGFNITKEMSELLILLAPFVAAAIASRFTVTAPDTAERERANAYRAGLEHAQPSEPDLRPKMRTRIPNGEGIARMTRPEP